MKGSGTSLAVSLFLAVLAGCAPSSDRQGEQQATEKEAGMTLDQQAAYLKAHTPRILDGLKVKLVEGAAAGGHNEPLSVAYEVIPDGRGIEVLAARFESDGKVYANDPVYLRPLESAEPRLLFATWEHGWD